MTLSTQRCRRRLNGQEFTAALDQIGIVPASFAWLTGTNAATVNGWLVSEQDIPPWVPTMLGLLTLPGGPDMATAVAREFTKPEQDTPV
jgi:predicted ABC-type sugar transport system permease subunit